MAEDFSQRVESLSTEKKKLMELYLKKNKLDFAIGDLYKHPSIRETSADTHDLNAVKTEEFVAGEVDLSSSQKWFFKRKFNEMHHWNIATMVYSGKGFDESIIRKVFAKIVEHHDALRMVFRFEGEKVVQFNRGMDGELFTLAVYDYHGEAGYEASIKSEVDKLQLSIDLSKGPLLKLGLFKTDVGDHLLVIIHHLICDRISFEILSADFINGYIQAFMNKEIEFPPKTMSFKDWTKKLNTYTTNQELCNEAEFWQKQAEIEIVPLPKDNPITIRKNADCLFVNTCLLEENETAKLLNAGRSFYKTNTMDLILTALGETFRQWNGESKVLIDLLILGRDSFDADVDVSRTIGWMNMGYPIIIDLKGYGDIGRQVLSIKEFMNSVPKGGLRYREAIEYLEGTENKTGVNYWLHPEVLFNFTGENARIGFTNGLGNIDADLDITISPISAGECFGSSDENNYSFQFNLEISQGRLNLALNYNTIEYKESTVEGLIQGIKKNLRRVIESVGSSGLA